MSAAALALLALGLEPPKPKVSPTPELMMVWPWVVNPGKNCSLILRGNHLGERKSLEVIQGSRVLSCKPSPKHQDFPLPEGMEPKRHGNQTLAVEVEGKDATPGWAKITISGSSTGKSELPLEITSQKVVEEKEPNNDLATPQILDTFPSRVMGQIFKNQDCDVYQVALKRGQQLGIRLVSRTKGSLLDPILTLQSKDGSVLAQTGPKGSTNDLLLFHTARSDGPVCLVIQDAFDSGGSQHGYELRIHAGPQGSVDP